MAGSNRESEAKRINPTGGQGTSRVSKATGRIGSPSVQAARVEQHTNLSSTTKQSSRTQTSKKQITRGRQSGNKKSATRTRSISTPIPASSSSAPRDTKFLQWAYEKWNSLEPHHQQRVFSILLLILSLVLLASLTIFASAPLLQGIHGFFLTFFGWGAYPLALGLVAFAIAHLLEGLRNQRLIRWPLVIGLVVIWLLLLMETRLILGSMKVGALAEVLVILLLGWPPAIGHVLVLGLLALAIILTFRITFGHVLLVADYVRQLFAENGPSAEESKRRQASPFLGLRPKYSHYMGGGKEASAQAKPAPKKRQVQQDDDIPLNEQETVPLEDDLGGEYEDEEAEDPLNDINVHKQEVGLVPRGRRVPKQLDPEEHAQAVQGASQHELPFDEQVALKFPRKAPKKVSEMESLAPNPRLPGQPKARAASQPAQVIVSSWKLPDTALLNNPDEVKLQLLGDDTTSLAKTIQDTLRSFRVDAEVRPEDISIGPTVIRFGIRPTGKPEMKMDEKTHKMMPVRDSTGNIVYETRTRVSRIMALQNDLALVLEAKAIRMEAPVPGRPYVGVEIPNKNSRLVTLREVLESKEYQGMKAKSKLAIALGRDVAGKPRVGDLARMPHLLIAGATGAGKSVAINTIIASILTQATPDDVRLLMVDPKMVELSMYNGIPHLLSPVVTEVDKVVPLLKRGITEMEQRYRLFSQLGVRNLDGYRKMRLEKLAKGDTSLNNLPAIVIIIDELADLMMAAPEEVEGMICRLAQLARATGIHLVIATQRPSVDVITGLIKANIPTRISFMVSSAVDSRTIIDMGGAERLLGRGDMLYLPADAGRPERIQGAFLADEEAEALVHYWRQQIIERAIAIGEIANPAEAENKPQVEPGWEISEQPAEEFELDDELLDKAEEVVREYGRASISLLQRRLRIGYSRAARLIDLLEEHGIIGSAEGGGRSREVLDGSSDDGFDDGELHTLADEAVDIMADQQRNEFLRQQAEAIKRQKPAQNPPHEDIS